MGRSDLPTIYRVSDTKPLTWGDAMKAWTPRAVAAVLDAASLNDTITYAELAERVQSEAGVRTSEPVDSWMARLLERVETEGAAQDKPGLAAFCVPARGQILAPSPKATRARAPRAPATPKAPKSHAAKEAARKRALEEAPPSLCPTCFTQLPASGACDYCD
ncbi:MAG: hypothetical protein LBH13_07055 [Cellulomonadaceae bacterium]|jgi:hypothetical protein|nr:hypothetical protein [Cellulomonadaceae bacterium]